jgi:hypothetical protein
MNFLPVSHLQQQQQADCLVACVAMVLRYNEFVYINDPALDSAPQSVTLAEFDLAWLEMENLCCVIRL